MDRAEIGRAVELLVGQVANPPRAGSPEDVAAKAAGVELVVDFLDNFGRLTRAVESLDERFRSCIGGGSISTSSV